MDIEIIYHYRKLNDIFIKDKKELIFIEDDSTPKEEEEQINLYFKEFIDNKNIAEYKGYTKI